MFASLLLILVEFAMSLGFCGSPSNQLTLPQQCQQTQLLQWLAEARKTETQSIVFSVSRDAVSLGLAPFGFFEMASVATTSVLADGKRLGTVYLGRTQNTLSQPLSSSLRLTLKSCEHQPYVVYVTDADKVETAYWKNELSKFYVITLQTVMATLTVLKVGISLTLFNWVQFGRINRS